jgi:hypothetical protein
MLMKSHGLGFISAANRGGFYLSEMTGTDKEKGQTIVS